MQNQVLLVNKISVSVVSPVHAT